jgi:hypothetical protein
LSRRKRKSLWLADSKAVLAPVDAQKSGSAPNWRAQPLLDKANTSASAAPWRGFIEAPSRATDLLHLSDIETSAREGLLLFNSVPEFEIASDLISFEARIDAGDALRGCNQHLVLACEVAYFGPL